MDNICDILGHKERKEEMNKKRINALEQKAQEYRSKRDLVVTIAIAAMLLLLGFLCSCKSQYMPGTDTETSINVRDREVPVYTPSDSASILALLECDSLNRVVMRELEIEKGKRIVPTIKPIYIPATTQEQKPQVQLLFDCKEDSMEHIIHVQDSIINRLRTERPEPIVIKEKGFVYYCGVVFIAIICLVFVWQVAKVVLKFYGVKL